jgi:hypothetical protein
MNIFLAFWFVSVHKVLTGTIVTADHAVKTNGGWMRVRDTGAVSVFRQMSALYSVRV